jgi:hypothetical protein
VHRGRVRQRLRGHGFTAHHAGDFLHSGIAIKGLDLALRRGAVTLLGHAQMLVAQAGDLRQVGHAQNLAAFAECP